MAQDGLFFKSVGWTSPRTGAPVVAIVLQGILATIIALSGKYEQILNYDISVDFISFAFTAGALFVFRRRVMEAGYRHPGHPYTTGVFILACVAIVVSTVIASPVTSVIGFGILLTGVPAYLYWKRK
jgi:APA family basic amino acid/polyamine antiporter